MSHIIRCTVASVANCGTTPASSCLPHPSFRLGSELGRSKRPWSKKDGELLLGRWKMVAAAYESRTHRKALVLRQVRSEEGEKRKWHVNCGTPTWPESAESGRTRKNCSRRRWKWPQDRSATSCLHSLCPRNYLPYNMLYVYVDVDLAIQATALLGCFFCIEASSFVNKTG